MRPRRRRQSRADWLENFYHAAQYARLQAIARGELEPLYDRERYFLWTLDMQGRADPEDFILPSLLFVAEREIQRQDEDIAATSSPSAD